MDVQKQIEYWRDMSDDDLEAADALLDKRKIRQALFFAELALEKILKAQVAAALNEIPPRTHDLLRLVELAQIDLAEERRLFIARFQQYCLEGRYPKTWPTAPSQEEANAEIQECREMIAWLKTQLK